MTEIEHTKINVAVIGGDRSVARTLKAHIDLLHELEQYRAIGTIEEFKALKEKATPKKDNNDGGRCKYCGTYNNFIINKLANPKGHPVIHCWNCGQAIDWQ